MRRTISTSALTLLLTAFGIFIFSLMLLVLIVPIQSYYHGIGMVEYKESMDVRTSLSGIISSVVPNNYQQIDSGNSIAIEDVSEFNASALQTKVESKLSKVKLQKYKKMFEDGSIGSGEFEDSERRYHALLGIENEFRQFNILAKKSGNFVEQFKKKEVIGKFLEAGTMIGIIVADTAAKIVILRTKDMIYPNCYVNQRVIFRYQNSSTHHQTFFWGKIIDIFRPAESGEDVRIECKPDHNDDLKKFPIRTKLYIDLPIEERSIISSYFGIECPGSVTLSHFLDIFVNWIRE